MASVPTAGIRYDISADNSKFLRAIEEAQRANKKAAEDMGSQFSEAADKATQAVERWSERLALKTIAAAGSVLRAGQEFRDIWQGGADAAEGAFTKAFDQAKVKIDDFIGNIARSRGRVAGALYDLLHGGIVAAIDRTAEVGAGLLERVMPSRETIERFTERWRGAMAAVGIDADAARERLLQLSEGARTAMQKIAGTFEGISDEVKAALDALDKVVERQAFGRNLAGRSRVDQAEMRAEQQFLQALGKTRDQLNQAEEEALQTRLLFIRTFEQEAEAAELARRENERYRQTVDSITNSLQRQTEMERAAANAPLQTAGQRFRARAEAMAGAARGGRGRDVLGAVSGDIDRGAREADISAAIQHATQMGQAVQQQTAALQLQMQTLGATAGRTAELTFQHQQLQQAQRLGVPVTEDLRRKIEEEAKAMGASAQAAAEARQRLQALQEVGRTVASNLEGAFAKFMDGTKQSWKSFVNDLAKDLARLQLRQALGFIFGNQANPMGIFGGLFGGGGTATHHLPGFASGGDVPAGRPVVVGEKGPELFYARTGGTIVPNSALRGGGGGSTINMRVDLTGANGDETIRRISAQAAVAAAAAAVERSNAGFATRQHQLRMLGA